MAGFCRSLAGVALLAALGGCGGSSNDAPSVTSQQCEASAGALGYGGLVTLPAGGQFVELNLASTVGTSRPTVAGAPAACSAGATYALEGTTLPPGLALDASTGVITGVLSAPGYYTTTVSISGPLFTDKHEAFLQWQVRDPAAFAWSGWDDGATGGHAIAASAVSLDVLGSRLALTFGGAAGVSTRQSADGGATWATDAPAHLPPAQTNFAVTDDGGTRLYVAGGRNAAGLLDEVWTFDGSDWQQVAAHAAFGPRENAQLFSAGGRLFLFGGQSASTNFFDLWRSDDGGQTWIQVTWPGANALPAPSLTCGAQVGTSVVMVGSVANYGTGSHPASIVWSSDNGGVTWSDRTPGSTSPFFSLNGGARQCAVLNGALVVVGSGGWWNTVVDVVSTSDIDHWTYQPRSDAFLTDAPVPGAAVLGGQLHVAFGSKLFTTHP